MFINHDETEMKINYTIDNMHSLLPNMIVTIVLHTLVRNSVQNVLIGK